MEITTKHYGGHNGTPSHGIEVTVTNWTGQSSITEDVTDIHGKTDEEFISSLRSLADELEENNEKLKNWNWEKHGRTR